MEVNKNGWRKKDDEINCIYHRDYYWCRRPLDRWVGIKNIGKGAMNHNERKNKADTHSYNYIYFSYFTYAIFISVVRER